MKVLVLTTLFPNCNQQRHGIFIKNRMLALKQYHPDVELTVVAPVPYVPKWLPLSSYEQYKGIPHKEEIDGIEVYHPKYLVIPKIGMNVTPYFLYQSVKRLLKSLIKTSNKFDIIDAHYFYPDGVVANWIAKRFKLPCIVTARGSDINIIPKNAIAAKRVKTALNEISAPAAVSQALCEKMFSLSGNKVQPVALLNGVDLNLFSKEQNTTDIRAQLGEGDKLIVSVGNLIELKGHHLVIEAIREMPNVKLLIIGDGPFKSELISLVERFELNERVSFTGLVTQSSLPAYYQAADALVLASSNEGMPNVLIETIASGTPVVATNVGGVPEVVEQGVTGEVVRERSAKSIKCALERVFTNNYSKKQIQENSQAFSWKSRILKHYELLKHHSTNLR